MCVSECVCVCVSECVCVCVRARARTRAGASAYVCKSVLCNEWFEFIKCCCFKKKKTSYNTYPTDTDHLAIRISNTLAGHCSTRAYNIVFRLICIMWALRALVNARYCALLSLLL